MAVEVDKDLQRKRDQRSKAAEIFIPPIKDLKRREACLADPERFLLTYGRPDEDKPAEIQDGRFWMPFAKHHHKMIDAIYTRAVSGGDKAVAAPRGDGKSTVVFWMLVYILLAELRRHPCGIGQTNAKAKEKLFDTVIGQLTFNDYLYEDFPEVCHPLRELDGAPARAAKQHVGGVKTRIKSDQHGLRLPIVNGYPSNYGGSTLKYYGFDGDIRGSRHDFAAIDDPEKRSVAFSQPHGNRKAQHEVIEELIDADVAGLAFPGQSMPRVVITTIQNRRCYSYRVTCRDLKQGGKPNFAGDCYGILESMPERLDLWEEYVSIRQTAQEESSEEFPDGDKDGVKALQFFLDNREEMERGAVVTNEYRFDHSNEFEVCALQSFFNKVADWGWPRVLAELQNNPEEEEQEETTGITPGLIQTRINGLRPNQLPSGVGERKITVGIDIGNWVCHWVKVCWFGNAVGVVLDEGELVVKNMIKNPDQAFLTKSLIEALHGWRNDIMSENPPDFAFIDSGSGLHQEAVYEFVRQAGGNPFAASKGWDAGRFRMPHLNAQNQPQPGKRLFYQSWAHHQPADRIWLYNVHTEWWKHWIQQRFMTPTFDNDHVFHDGSLSLHVSDDRKRWQEFASQLCAEGRETIFVPEKGYRTSWKVYNKKNHKLDAIALAAAAAGCLGVRLIQKQETPRIQPRKPVETKTFTTPDGRPFLATER